MALSPYIKEWWTRTPAAPLFWLSLTSYNLALGVALMLGDPARVSGASFVSVRAYGGPLAWGAALFVVGVLVTIGPLLGARALGWALAAAGTVHVLLAAGFVIAAHAIDDAAITGPITYLFVAAAHGLHARHYLHAR